MSAKAKFGSIPFDLFALERWNYDAPGTEDHEQWDRLVKEYCCLTPRDRHAYHLASMTVENDTSPSADDAGLLRFLTPEGITRVLEGRQTAQERIITPGCGRPLWVRTCYRPELKDKYAEFARACEIESGISCDAEMILDNAELYHLGPGRDETVSALLRRMPSLCDTIRGSVMEDYDFFDYPEQDGEPSSLQKASWDAQMVLYVADDEAVEENLVKLLWLNSHGTCVWVNKIEPMDLSGLSGGLRGGHNLADLVEEGLCRNNDPRGEEMMSAVAAKGSTRGPT